MFRIKRLVINPIDDSCKPSTYDFADQTFVVGGNSSGKSSLLKTIDFLLGHSDKNKISLSASIPGMDNVSSVEMKIENGPETLWIKRNETGAFFTKRSEGDSYIECEKDTFKSLVSRLAFKKDFSDLFSEYHVVYGEEPSFRSAVFLNYLQEVGQGDITSVFTDAIGFENGYRSHSLLPFLLDRGTSVAFARQQKVLDEMLDKNAFNANKMAMQEESLAKIRKGFAILHLPFEEKDIKENRAIFDDFCTHYTRSPATRKEPDIDYLLKLSYSLSEQIKSITFFQKQAKSYLSRQKKVDSLLRLFESISKTSDSYGKYSEEISKGISSTKTNYDFVDALNYEKTLTELVKRKNSVDQRIKEASEGSNPVSFEQTSQLTALINDAFMDYDRYSLTGTGYSKEDIRLQKEKVRGLNNQLRKAKNKEINDSILKYYKMFCQGISSIGKEFEKPGFEFKFSPSNSTISAYIFSIDPVTKETIEKPVDTGSLGRTTIWQVCAYLSCLSYFQEHSEINFVLPLFITDCITQAIHEPEEKKWMNQTISTICSDIGVQYIDILGENPGVSLNGKSRILPLCGGLNPFHQDIQK
jgi:energy-coupling factor transporter ATP-binding protein EcfA2